MKTLNQNVKASGILITIFLFSFGYAILRYHIFGPVLWKDLPLYTLNKGIALTTWIILTIVIITKPMQNPVTKLPSGFNDVRKTLGISSFLLVLIHVVISLILLKPAIYGKFFEPDGTLSLIGGLSLLAGVISFAMLWVFNDSFKKQGAGSTIFKNTSPRRFLLLSMLVGLLHLFFMGNKGWLKPADWYGGLPPMTLIAFAFFLVGYVTFYFINLKQQS